MAHVVVFGAALASSMTGYGFVVLSAPLLSLLLVPAHAVPLALALGWLLVSALLLRPDVRRAVDVRLAAQLSVAGAAGIPIGALLLAQVDAATLRQALGLSTAGVALVALATPRLSRRRRGQPWQLPTGTNLTNAVAVSTVGLLSGVLSGSVGLNGPPVALYLAAQGTGKDTFRATCAAVVWLLSTATLVVFIALARVPAELAATGLLLLPALLGGYGLGVYAFSSISRRRFQQTALALATVAGLFTAFAGTIPFPWPTCRAAPPFRTTQDGPYGVSGSLACAPRPHARRGAVLSVPLPSSGDSMATYRAAIIGLGRIADTIDDEQVGSGWLYPFSHMGSYAEVPDVRVVGAADLYAEQRAAFGRRWGIPDDHLYESYEDLLVREQPDIVSVCTSAAPRALIVLDIVRLVREGRAAVKAIWAEKPLAISLADADAMVEACREAGIVLVTNAMRASDAYYRRARALIDAGELGRMLQITAYGAGNLSHMGVHLIGAMCVLAGGSERVSWVVGEAESDAKAAGDADLAGNGYLAFENGARGFFRLLPSGPATWTIDAIGETGMIRIRNANEGYEFELWRMGQAVTGAAPAPVRHIFPRPQKIWSAGVGQVKDIIACIETGKEPNCSGGMGRHLLEIAIAIRESHRRGNVRVDLPLQDRNLYVRSSETLAGDTPVAMRPGRTPRRREGVLAEIARREGIGTRRLAL
ncbi:MAG: TSUP family transporter [Chloroflexi bacterium]|nr:TSUP family transporter [Chloroflexota bacterium]